jgi:1-acyl-sn-glycerol-3-phosphate acyltransferase
MRVSGLESVPARGPVLVVPNHDSQWDPVVVGVALRKRRRLHFLARASLWRIPGLGPVLYGMGQIPIERGAGDAQALASAVDALSSGAAICVFPEGRLSRGASLRARSGVGRLAAWCPKARVVLCAVAGATDYVRFPRRPRVSVSFFEPQGGQPRPDEQPGELAARLLDELRSRVPPVPAGRRAAAQ